MTQAAKQVVSGTEDTGVDARLALFRSSSSNAMCDGGSGSGSGSGSAHAPIKCKLTVVNDTTDPDLGPVYLCYVDDQGTCVRLCGVCVFC